MAAPKWFIGMMRRVGASLIVNAEVWDNSGERRNPEQIRRLAGRELAAVAESIRAFDAYQATEADILNARLSRRFDPGMALNEAAERAIAAKKAAKAEHTIKELTPTQQKALEFQKQYLQRIVDRA
jgi:hypothetical protein